jgi:hypothetical protein
MVSGLTSIVVAAMRGLTSPRWTSGVACATPPGGGMPTRVNGLVKSPSSAKSDHFMRNAAPLFSTRSATASNQPSSRLSLARTVLPTLIAA